MKKFILFQLFILLIINFSFANNCDISDVNTINTGSCESCSWFADVSDWSPVESFKYIGASKSPFILNDGYYQCDDFSDCLSNDQNTLLCNYKECIDEELYLDSDGDGYGDNSQIIIGCNQLNYVDNNLDCDDTNPSINPGAIEVCDGVDNDCSLLVDDGAQMQCTFGENNCDSSSDLLCWRCDDSCKVLFERKYVPPTIEVVGDVEKTLDPSVSNVVFDINAKCLGVDDLPINCYMYSSSECSVFKEENIIDANEIDLYLHITCPSKQGLYSISLYSSYDGYRPNLRYVFLSVNAPEQIVDSGYVKVFNTIPLAPKISTNSDHIVAEGKMTWFLEDVVDPDNFSTGYFANGNNSFTYGVIITRPAGYTLGSLVSSKEITLLNLDSNKEICFKTRVNDGFYTVDSNEYCIPFIDLIEISNSSSGYLANTKWIKNHDSSSDYENITCDFSAVDSDLASDGNIYYSVSLMAKDSNSTINSILVEKKYGVTINGVPASESFIVGKYPGQNYNYKVGTRFFCKVDVNDGFFVSNKSSYVGPNTWEPKLIWGNDTNVSTGYIEVVNSPPYYPADEINVEWVDRDLVSDFVQAQIKDANDADNNPNDSTQSFSYEGKIYIDHLGAVISDFNVPTILPRFFQIDLIQERNYCFKGRAFDSLEWSNVTNPLCSNENPFQPKCSDLSSPKLNVVLVKSSFVDKNLVFEFDVSCNSSRRINETWLIDVKVLSVIFDNSHVNLTSNVIDDCNITPQRLIVSTDSNLPGNYKIEFEFGGVFNGIPKYCPETIFFNVSNVSELNIPDNNFMLIILIIAVVSFILIPKKN